LLFAPIILMNETEKLIEAAFAGDAYAQEQLGNFYLDGLGVAKDTSKAIRWLLKSAGNINQIKGEHLETRPLVCETLEKLYLDGKWPAAMQGEAVSWFQTAAEKGYPQSQFIMGLVYRDGLGVKQSFSEALKWFQASADHKHRVEWHKRPAQGEPKVPEAQKAVEATRKLLVDSNPEAKHWTFGGVDELCAAVNSSNSNKVRALIASGTCVNAPMGAPGERSPFFVAASRKFTQGEVDGIRKGYDPNQHDYWKRSSGNREILLLLADNGAKVFLTQYGSAQSSIHAAARADNADAITIILAAHPEVGNYNTDHESPTPLEVAAEGGNFRAVKALLATTGNKYQITSPFELALKGGYTRTAKELIAYMPQDFPLVEKHSATFFEMLAWSAVDNHVESFRFFASKYLALIKRSSTSLNRERSDLWCEKEKVLEDCFRYACFPCPNLEMIELIFGQSESLDINKVGVKDWQSWSVPPLIYAAEIGSFELTQFCLRLGADPFIHDRGKTPLDIARLKGHVKLVVLLEQTMKGNYTGRVKSLFRKF
jgi:hypothetical protein